MKTFRNQLPLDFLVLACESPPELLDPTSHLLEQKEGKEKHRKRNENWNTAASLNLIWYSFNEIVADLFWKYTRSLRSPVFSLFPRKPLSSFEFDASSEEILWGRWACAPFPPHFKARLWHQKQFQFLFRFYSRAKCERCLGGGGGWESAILRTWPDNDDNVIAIDADVGSRGNMHWPQAG